MVRQAEDFETLVRDHARVMSAAIRRVCGRRHQSLIPDVQQEVHLALWKRLQTGKGIEYPASYLYKVALTTALAVLRKLRPDSITPLDEERDIEAPDTSRTDGLLPAERGRLIEEALGCLGPDQERALRAYLSGFNHREVAHLFGWSESVARHRIYRSIEELKVKMNPIGSEPR